MQSPVMEAFQGRKAATSIDRILSGVSLDAGRYREGGFTTGLNTDLSRIMPKPGTDFEKAMAGAGFVPDPTLATAEAARCHQCDCSPCIKACNSFIESFEGFPGRYAREIYNNLSIVMGERTANLMINSCTLCDLCATVCPNDFSMADLCLQARRQMLEDKRMPVSAHAFALEEMAHAMGDACFFERHAHGMDHSDILFFPGCRILS
ncbi:4Fe-4S dicluster domain-containing protein [Desulfobacter postgatei]|uniref:4Fe-4S dicluster domain-containing protein n=1 Tax=Desulfobacter postgatei TaxID=2293 RepID=UPI00259B1827|nr:4Fe-4S dicluster domain-containing protein [uncultured Desulfobacter sp.]